MPPKKWGKAAGGDATLTTPPADSGGASPKPKAKAWGKAKASESGSASEPKAKAKAWGKKADASSESAPKAKAKAWGKKADSSAVDSGTASKEPEPAAVADGPSSGNTGSELASMKAKLQEAEAKAAEVAELKTKLEEAASSAGEYRKEYQAELVSMGETRGQVRNMKEHESEAMQKVAAIVKKENDSHVSELKAQLQAEQWRLQAVEVESGAERMKSQVLRLETAESECKRVAEIEAEKSNKTIAELRSEMAELRSEMQRDRMKFQEDQAKWGEKVPTGAAPSKVESLAADLRARLDTGNLVLYKTDPRFWK